MLSPPTPPPSVGRSLWVTYLYHHPGVLTVRIRPDESTAETVSMATLIHDIPLRSFQVDGEELMECLPDLPSDHLCLAVADQIGPLEAAIWVSHFEERTQQVWTYLRSLCFLASTSTDQLASPDETSVSPWPRVTEARDNAMRDLCQFFSGPMPQAT